MVQCTKGNGVISTKRVVKSPSFASGNSALGNPFLLDGLGGSGKAFIFKDTMKRLRIY